jgi:hypothetical protein
MKKAPVDTGAFFFIAGNFLIEIGKTPVSRALPSAAKNQSVRINRAKRL